MLCDAVTMVTVIGKVNFTLLTFTELIFIRKPCHILILKTPSDNMSATELNCSVSTIMKVCRGKPPRFNNLIYLPQHAGCAKLLENHTLFRFDLFVFDFFF